LKRKQPRLGVDLGGVVIDKYAIDPKTGVRYPRQHPDIPEVKDAFDALFTLNTLGVQIYTVSSGGLEVERGRKTWLARHKFFERTHVPAWNLRFCEERKNKLIWCKHLGITHFVDDRAEVLSALASDVPYLYLFRPRPRLNGEGEAHGPEPFMERSETWHELTRLLIRDIEAYQLKLGRVAERLTGLDEADEEP